MTYENVIDLEFDHNGEQYGATANVFVTMRKEDIGPIGYRQHVYSYVTKDVEIKDLKVGLVQAGEDLSPIPEEVRQAAEEEINHKASVCAEESMV